MLASDTLRRPPAILRRAGAAIAAAPLVAAPLLMMSPAAAEAPHRYHVTIDVPDDSPFVGARFAITGTVSPAADGGKVLLQRLKSGEFRTVATTRLDHDSTYSFSQAFDTVGGRTFRVVKPAAHRIERGESPRRRVFVTGTTIESSVVMKSGDHLTSAKGTYLFTMLSTGDLVITLASNGRTIWSFGTGGHPGATAMLQRDGDFVVRDAQGKLVKATGTGGHAKGSYRLSVREYADMLIAKPDGTYLWSNRSTNSQLRRSETLYAGQFLLAPGRHSKLVMQAGGNLVLVDVSTGAVLWDSGTATPGSHVVMGPGGSMIVFDPQDKELWSSHTTGYAGTYLALAGDATMALYHRGSVIWASEPQGEILGDDYPAYLRDAERDSIIDPWHFYNRECTSFTAWRMNSANGIDFDNFMGGGRFGSAYNWDDNARALGYRVDTVPARGAIAQSDREGHVAWVAAVGDGVVTIEDYNWIPGEYDVRTVATTSYVYIHIKDL